MSAEAYDTADAPTLHEALRARGFYSRESATINHRVILDRTGRVVGLMTAAQAWSWVHAGCPMRGTVAEVPELNEATS